jgi:hypothetical protein
MGFFARGYCILLPFVHLLFTHRSHNFGLNHAKRSLEGGFFRGVVQNGGLGTESAFHPGKGLFFVAKKSAKATKCFR